MNAAQIAKTLGGDVIGKDRVLAPGPGHSPRDRSMSVLFDANAPDGFLVDSFAGDDWRACRDHVRAALGIQRTNPAHGQLLPKRAARVHVLPPSSHWRKIWRDTFPVRGTVVGKYLASRKLRLSDDLDGTLGFHPGIRAMVALFRDIATNEPCGIHRTFLTASGEKIERKMLGRAKAAAIKLDADEHITTGLFIGEGVETCIAARLAGFRPCWALGSAGAIASFPVLAGIECLTILGENDNGANAKAAKACADRWAESECAVAMIQPNEGSDLNDVWSGMQ